MYSAVFLYYIYMYIYIYLCVCVCVCVRVYRRFIQRNRETVETARESVIAKWLCESCYS